MSDEGNRRTVERAITMMQENLGEPLTIDDIARSAAYSKFHFARMFRDTTGISPGRFLSALRIAEAKRLLLRTNHSVSALCHDVGYTSVSTFSMRFHRSVGCSPSAYRQSSGLAGGLPEVPVRAPSRMTVRGHVSLSTGAEHGSVFVGLFPGPVLEQAPVCHAVLPGPGPYTLHDVPPGTWHVVAHAPGQGPDGRSRAYVGRGGTFTVRPGVTHQISDVGLRPRSRIDPPVLLVLPDLERHPELQIAG